MSANFWGHRRGRVTHLTLAAILCGAGSMHSALAQAAPSQSASRWSAPHWEVYGGYSALNTGATVYGLLPGGVAPASGCLCWDAKGVGADVAYKVNPWLSVTGDMSGNWEGGQTTLPDRLTHADFYNISAGPRFSYSVRRFTPFSELVAGGHRLAPDLFPHSDAFGFMAGGGVDLRLSRHLALRMVRADYVYSNHHFGPDATVPTTDVRGVRLQSGLVYHFGGEVPAPPAPVIPPPPPPPPPLPPPAEVIEPPTVTCSADPESVAPAETSTITAHGMSPQNRPLVYSYRSTAGSISGTAATTTLDTSGAAAGPITVTCVAIDDKNQSVSATTSVTVVVPPVPVRPKTVPLCSIHFERDVHRPTRVDNEAKGCLDDITLSLQRSPDARLAIVGHAAGSEHNGNTLATERGVNTKAYLVGEKGVDASRIVVYTGSEDGKQVDSVLIPAGAILDQTGVTAVDEASVKPHPRTQAKHRSR
jgi:hypothetical protein